MFFWLGQLFKTTWWDNHSCSVGQLDGGGMFKQTLGHIVISVIYVDTRTGLTANIAKFSFCNTLPDNCNCERRGVAFF